MTLKTTRITVPDGDDISNCMNEVAERGIIVIRDTSSTGLGNLDDPNSVVSVPTGTNGTPVGILTNDVVSKDLTQTHLNAHKDEVQVGGKVCVNKLGTWQTNKIKSGDTPVPGDPAHYGADGEFTTTTTSTKVGTFTSALDADGYAVVDIRL